MKCDVKIMAVPSRMANVVDLCGKLGLTINDCAIDYEYSRLPLKTSRAAFELPYEDGVTHRLVLQDDVKICENLMAFCDMLVNRFPDCLISLFQCDRSRKKNTLTPYSVIGTNFMTGQGIIIPKKYLGQIYAYLDQHNPMFPHDDWYYNFWCKLNNIKMLTVYPNVVDSYSLAEMPTEMNHKGIMEVKTIRFEETDPMQHEWLDMTDVVMRRSLGQYLTYDRFINNVNV